MTTVSYPTHSRSIQATIGEPKHGLSLVHREGDGGRESVSERLEEGGDCHCYTEREGGSDEGGC